MDKLYLGKIVNTHGIKGEVRVQSVTDQPEERYQSGQVIYLKMNDDFQPLTIDRYRTHKSFDLLSFKEYDNINQVEPFVQSELWIDKEDINELEDNEYYVHEVIGYEVIDEKGSVVGHLKDIMPLPANDVWVIAREGKDDVLLPGIKEVILQVDHNLKQINVHMIEGLDEDDN